MPELSRAHDTPTAAVAHDGVAGDVKEGDVSDIVDGVAGLKVDDGMPTAPTESASASNGRSTKNCDDDRKIVVSHLHSSNLFKIPDGLDLEDKTKVEEWYVRYDELFIVYKNGVEQAIGTSQELI